MRKPTNAIQAPMTVNLVSTAATSSTGALVTSTAALNIDNGEVALLSTDASAADFGQLTATPDGNTVKIVQGTPKSNNIADTDPWGVKDPALVETDKIYKDGVRSINSVNYTSGSYAMSAFTSVPTPIVNSEYGLIIELDGRRQEREFGANQDQPSTTVTTPASAPTDIKDFVLQSLAHKLNTRSQLTGATKRFAVLGINTAGDSGQALSGIVNDNSAIDFITIDGVTYNIQATTPLVRGLARLIAASSDIDGDSTIEVIDVTSAGDAALIDALVVVGLDADAGVYEDDVYHVRTDVDINPSDQFQEEGTVTKVYAEEEEGSGRVLNIDARHRAQLQIHTQQLTPYMEYFSEGYSYLDPSKNYGATYIDYIGKESSVDHEYIYEKQAVILWEQTEPTTLGVAADTGITAVLAFTPSESAPAVVAQFTTWAD